MRDGALMGGELRECGCFDGPWAAEDPTLVSVRCDEHFEDGPLDGYVLMRRNQAGVAVAVRTRASLPTMAIPGMRRNR